MTAKPGRKAPKSTPPGSAATSASRTARPPARRTQGGPPGGPGRSAGRQGDGGSGRSAGRQGDGGSGRSAGRRGSTVAGRQPGTVSPRSNRAPSRERATPQVLLASYRPDLSGLLASVDAPQFRYAQVLEHLLRRPLRPFAEASVLPVGLRESLDQAGVSTLWTVAQRKGTDGTTKLLLEAADGSRIEAVLMPYGSRVTACISSQVGCAVGCAFCATGAMGFLRNLTNAEIVDQLRAASESARSSGRKINNVVYMGMGEPLLNLGAVLDSIRLLTAPSGLGLSHRAISVSTVGIPGGILRLARTEPQVNLALSLHASDDATRAVLVPEGFRRPLAQILDAAWEHFAITGRKLLVEYVLLSGVNDSIDHARRLAALLKGHVVTVNLLAWNPVCPDKVDPVVPVPAARGKVARLPVPPAAGLSQPPRPPAPRPCRAISFRPSSAEAMASFRAILRAAHIEAVVRQSRGAGIEAACGQLAGGRGSYQDGLDPGPQHVTYPNTGRDA
jgi:23S rRNA (adenine2503-C2)-methyltransferase